MGAAALTALETATAQAIRGAVPAAIFKRWASALDSARPYGQHCQTWLWSTPAKYSTRHITDGREISRDEFGRMVATLEGGRFKLEFRDRSEDV